MREISISMEKRNTQTIKNVLEINYVASGRLIEIIYEFESKKYSLIYPVSKLEEMDISHG